ncbi:MAG: carboxypeptidase-like regulatory domain-containing protein, partial [Bacteroidota bacterium]
MSKIKHFFCSLALMLLTISAIQAQQQIRGKVTGQDGDALVGVNVSVKGTTRGTTTDANGDYRIEAALNSILVFSYVGFTVNEVTIKSNQEINVTMKPNDSILDEVVVVGYGSVNKKEVTGAVQTLKYKELQDIPVSQIGQKLQGQVAGVQINQSTGKPGTGMTIRVRGQLS